MAKGRKALATGASSGLPLGNVTEAYNSAEKVEAKLNELDTRVNLVWGEVQETGYLNSMDAVLNYTVPDGCVMVGLYSYHDNGTEDRRWKIRYRTLSLATPE